MHNADIQVCGKHRSISPDGGAGVMVLPYVAALPDDGLGDETEGMKLCRSPHSIEEAPHTTQDRSPHPRETIPKHLSWITALTRVRQAASSAKNVLSKRASDTCPLRPNATNETSHLAALATTTTNATTSAPPTPRHHRTPPPQWQIDRASTQHPGSGTPNKEQAGRGGKRDAGSRGSASSVETKNENP